MLLKKIYEILYEAFGPQYWWPGETPLEVAVGAILTQNTAWKNVEKAIRNLKSKNLLYLDRLLELDNDKLAELIRPSGFYRQKAQRLKEFLIWLEKKGGCFLKINDPTEVIRNELLSIKGIGPETADSILLYAMERPVFVVDAYTKRVLARHRIIRENANYHEVQSFFMHNLPYDVQLYKEYHALFVKLGKEYCKKSSPLCSTCPLKQIF